MIRLFRHFVPQSAVLLAAGQILLFFVVVATFQASASTADLNANNAQVMMGVWIGPAVIIAMSSLGIYNRNVMYQMEAVLLRAIIAVPLSFFILMAAFFLFFGVDVTFKNAAVFTAVPICLLLALLTHGLFARLAASDRLSRRILVIGNGLMAEKVAQMARSDHKRLSVVGFVDCGGQAEGRVLNPSLPVDNLRAPEAMLNFVRSHEVEEIVVATRERRGLPLDALLNCRMTGLTVQEFSSFCESEGGFVDLDALHPSWLIFSDGFRMDRGRLIIKTAVDYLVAAMVLLVTLPITVPTAIAIKLTSRGPIFFRQERVGADGKVFNVLKFRSMRTDAEKAGPQWAKVDDDRVTKIGRFIRKVRIDEIPQVINVLRGEMSFIGPRPERPFFVNTLCQTIPYFNERHRIKPGITGWAQVNYPYGASIEDAKNKLSYDLYYLKNGGIFLDVVILLQTVRVVLWPSGAR